MAWELGIAEVTVKIHRARVMEKLEIKNQAIWSVLQRNWRRRYTAETRNVRRGLLRSREYRSPEPRS